MIYSQQLIFKKKIWKLPILLLIFIRYDWKMNLNSGNKNDPIKTITFQIAL